MKNLLFFTTVLFLSCGQKKAEKQSDNENVPQTEAVASIDLGKTLFETTGNCVACHQPAQKVIGPSITEIAQTYKAKNANIVSFLKDDAEPIVDPSQYSVMKTNFAITKKMSDVELKSIEMYIYSFAK